MRVFVWYKNDSIIFKEEIGMANDLLNELKNKIPAEKIEEVKDRIEEFAENKVSGISGEIKEKLENAIKEKNLDGVDSLKDAFGFFSKDNK